MQSKHISPSRLPKPSLVCFLMLYDPSGELLTTKRLSLSAAGYSQNVKRQ